ncbi:MAG: methyltransferase family protein, partial [Alphaproteobacteria bacterium]
TVLVYVPAALLWARGEIVVATPGEALFWAALLLALPALGLMGWTMRLFARFGDGTPAPWDPPQRFVLRGPYRHLRNPMITGVLIFLLAEAAFFRSWDIAAWFAVFLAANAVYFPLIEEKGLAARFGADYARYKANVPRWLPRLTPWSPDDETD